MCVFGFGFYAGFCSSSFSVNGRLELLKRLHHLYILSDLLFNVVFCVGGLGHGLLFEVVG